MRILVASHAYPPTVSGVSVVAQKLARAMVRKGHQVTLVTSGGQRTPIHEDDQGVHLIKVNSIPNPFWKQAPIPIISQRSLEEIADQFEPDILHTHDAALLGLQFVRLGNRARIPVIATCHFVPKFVAMYITWNDEPHESIEATVWSYALWLFDQFSHVVFPTEAHRSSFRERGLEAPSTVISNGIDTTRYHPRSRKSKSLEARYQLPSGPRVLFVGRLAPDKEIEILIQAMKSVHEKCQAHLLIVGRGDHRSRLEALTEELGLQQAVHFLGFVPEADLPRLYRAADVFAIASRCEVQSLPTLQALATALPVVAADAMALPEIVHHQENGLLVPPGDPKAMAEALLEILQDGDKARRFGQAGLAIAQAHSESHTFDQYEALYGELVRQEALHPSVERYQPFKGFDLGELFGPDEPLFDIFRLVPR